MSLILFPFKLVFGTVLLPLRIARIPLKILGFRGTLGLGIGVAVGVLVAPRPGAQTRQMLRERYEGGAGSSAPAPAGGTSVPAA